MVVTQKPTIRWRPLTIGQRCPEILSDMYLPVIFVKRLNLGATLLLDYCNLFLFLPNLLRWCLWILFRSYLCLMGSTIFWLLLINQQNTEYLFLPPRISQK